MIKKKIVPEKALKIGLILVLITVVFLTSRAALQRMASFGCFDQCFNFVAAYFMLKGKTLYSQVFFNHQPLMAGLSYLVQSISHPSSALQLVLFHRRFIVYFSLIMSLLLIRKFKWVGVGFVLFYELIKYYYFGHFFLPEVLVAYFLAFLLGLAWKKEQSQSLSRLDWASAAILTWLVIFLRTAFIPAALFLYASLFLKKDSDKKKHASFLLLATLITVTLLLIPLKDYWFQVFQLNWQVFASNQLTIPKIIEALFYPLALLGKIPTGKYFSLIMGLLSLVWLAGSLSLFFRTKKRSLLLIIFLALGLSAIRAAPPDKVFYEAFNMLPWLSVFLMSLFLILKANRGLIKKVLLFSMVAIFIFIIFPSHSFLWEKTDQEKEWNTNYLHYFLYGETIKHLAGPKETLFLDQWDDLIYWQSGLDSPFQYSLYTPVMKGTKQFDQARIKMFKESPPDFYYALCDDPVTESPWLPEFVKDDYLQLYAQQKPTCLYLKKTKISEIKKEQWEKAKELGLSVPPTP